MTTQDKNKKYVRPILVKYGSVRNLTGGSGPNNGDGGQGMMV